MLKYLISLVFLLMSLHCGYAFSDTNSIILPKTKPKKLSIALEKEKLSIILPVKKPIVKKKTLVTKKNILPKNKPEGKKNLKKNLEEKKSKISTLVPKEKPVQKKEVVSSDAVVKKVETNFLLPEKNQ